MDPAPCCQAVARGQQCPEGTARAPSLAAMNQPRDPTSRFLSQTPGPRLGGGGQERAALGGSRGGKGGHLEGRARCPLAASLHDGERLVCSNWKSSGYNTSFSKRSPKQSCSGKAAFHRTSFGHTALRRTLSSSPPAALWSGCPALPSAAHLLPGLVLGTTCSSVSLRGQTPVSPATEGFPGRGLGQGAWATLTPASRHSAPHGLCPVLGGPSPSAAPAQGAQHTEPACPPTGLPGPSKWLCNLNPLGLASQRPSCEPASCALHPAHLSMPFTTWSQRHCCPCKP